MRADLEGKRGRLVILCLRLACALAVLIFGVVRGCSDEESSTRPTNFGPFNDVVHGDIPKAGMTVLQAEERRSEHAGEGELYLIVQAAEGQSASAAADKLLSIVQKYKEEFKLRWLHVIVEASGEGLYERTFDLTTRTESD